MRPLLISSEVTSPNGSDTAGSLFAFSLFSDAAGTIPVLTSDPNGIAMTVSLNDQGSLTSNIISPDIQITPEPSTAALLTVSLGLFAAGFARRRLTQA